MARFALPLELCQSTNRTRGAAGWAQARIKGRVAALMALQCERRSMPLPGRPQVLCVRFSVKCPDAYSNWAKAPVDVLCAPKGRARNRLSLIRDDSPDHVEEVQWWEPAKMNEGFVVIEVWSGST